MTLTSKTTRASLVDRTPADSRTDSTRTDRALPAPSAPRARPVVLGRKLAAGALVAGAALNTAEAVLGQFLPERPASVPEQLRLVADHAVLYSARTVIGTLAVPVMAVAFLAAAKVTVPAARRTSVAGAVLLLAGMWGFLGVHVLGLLQLPAARLGGSAGAAGLLERAQADPVLGLMFLLPFLVGCAAGLLLLVVALFRCPGLPRWIPCAWLLFLVLDFAVRPGGPVDPHWLFLAGAVGLAVQVLRRRVAAFV